MRATARLALAGYLFFTFHSFPLDAAKIIGVEDCDALRTIVTGVH